MIFLALGVLVGVLICVGPLNVLATPFDAVANWLTGLGGDVVTAMLTHLGGLGPLSRLTLVLSAVLSVMTPGLVAMLLVLSARAAQRVRRVVAVLLVLIAVGGFFVLPLGQAVLLAVFALVVGGLTGLLGGPLLVLPLTVVATVLGVRYGVLLWTGQSAAVARGALQLSGVTDPELLSLWRLMLTVAGLIPFFAAAVAVFGPSRRTDEASANH